MWFTPSPPWETAFCGTGDSEWLLPGGRGTAPLEPELCDKLQQNGGLWGGIFSSILCEIHWGWFVDPATPMKTIIAKMATGLVTMIMMASAFAQEGHPMAGSWVGDWGRSPTQRNRVVIEMKWSGKELVGNINPGPRAIPFRVATVDPNDWSLHIEADAKDPQGRTVTYVIDGKLDNLGSYNRDISGTWNVGTSKGDFRIYRQ